MKEIKLSQSGKHKGKYVALVDDWNYEWLNQWKWNVQKSKYTYYARRYVRTKSGITIIFMHRLIMKTPDNLQCDHKNKNGLNNQEYNLRNCTNGQN